jgi:hypothetical protein
MSAPVCHTGAVRHTGAVCLTGAQLARDLAVPDLSDPADGPHAIQLLAGQAAAALTGAWGCGARWCRGPRVVTIADNYDHLGYEPAAVTRTTRPWATGSGTRSAPTLTASRR